MLFKISSLTARGETKIEFEVTHYFDRHEIFPILVIHRLLCQILITCLIVRKKYSSNTLFRLKWWADDQSMNNYNVDNNAITYIFLNNKMILFVCFDFES